MQLLLLKVCESFLLRQSTKTCSILWSKRIVFSFLGKREENLREGNFIFICKKCWLYFHLSLWRTKNTPFGWFSGRTSFKIKTNIGLNKLNKSCCKAANLFDKRGYLFSSTNWAHGYCSLYCHFINHLLCFSYETKKTCSHILRLHGKT